MKYPYYIVPIVDEYRKLDPHSKRARELSRKIAANIGDYPTLRLVLGIDPPEFARFYPDMETASPTTMDTIDSFLDKFGTTLPEQQPMEAYQLEEEEVANEANDLETLMKERRYREALMLIESENLNNPQKSIYFAHQIRFLKKLIAIDKYRNQNLTKD